MRSKLLLICGSLLSVLLLSACEKDEGPAGPAGPAGPQGQQGNANVKTAVFSNQAFTFNQLANVYRVLKTVPEITAAIVQNGSVMAYIAKANNNNADWTALPGEFTPDINNAAQKRFFNFNFSSGGATIYTSTNPGYNVDLKIVIVGGVIGSMVHSP